MFTTSGFMPEKKLSLFLLPLLTLMLACGQSDRSSSSTTIIENVTGYTFYDGELIEFSALAFEEGRVIDVYQDTAYTADNATIIDGQGKFMLPGLIDAHGHVMGLGFQQVNVDLTGSQSLDEALQQVRDYASEYTDINWVQGRGWNHTHWEINRFPTAEELDEAENERPVWLTRVDGHAGWANSKAMEAAGITAETEAPQGGKIIRDESGEPTGIFVDAAMDLIESEIPESTAEEEQLALEKALEQMRRHGLTGVHDAGVDVSTWELYKRFANQEKMTTRIYGMISGAGATFDSLSLNGPVESYADDHLALQSVKLYSDGALGSRGAAMIEPYSDDPENRGLLFSTEEEMTRYIMKTASQGYQTNIHAIGDRANRVVLNAFEKVRDSLGNQGLRHRIEHAQIVAPDDIPRFKELDIIPSMQPTHATSDMNMAEDRVGPERIKGSYAWQTFLDQGTLVASGSDFPVEHVNPFYGIYSAITRQSHDGQPTGGWYPSETMTREQALRSFTIDAAYAAHNERELGSLEPGKWADFILVDRDLFNIPEDEIWQIDVLETWVGGQKVYGN